MLLDNMIGLREDYRVMAHGRLYKIVEKLYIYIYIYISIFILPQQSHFLFIFSLAHQSLCLFIFIQINKMLSSSSCHDFSSSDEKMLFDEMDQDVVMFIQCVFNFSTPKAF